MDWARDIYNCASFYFPCEGRGQLEEGDHPDHGKTSEDQPSNFSAIQLDVPKAQDGTAASQKPVPLPKGAGDLEEQDQLQRALLTSLLEAEPKGILESWHFSDSCLRSADSDFLHPQCLVDPETQKEPFEIVTPKNNSSLSFRSSFWNIPSLIQFLHSYLRLVQTNSHIHRGSLNPASKANSHANIMPSLGRNCNLDNQPGVGCKNGADGQPGRFL